MNSRVRRSDSDFERPVRVALFTDTFGDVNGVSRFLNDIADCSLECNRSLHILTSTRMPVRTLQNVHNVAPRAAVRLPGYRDLELVFPPVRRLFELVRRVGPDVIHISTPGPVGLVGRLIARRLNIPLAGVYHTDFPAYVDHLFDDAALTHIARGAMRRFYRPFRCVFARSNQYGESLGPLGIESDRRVRLRPGFNTERFHPRFQNKQCWAALGVPASSVKVLYVGRVSVEKNLPLLAEIWKRVRALSPGIDSRLIIVGDGPYRANMETSLAGCNAHFVGFRHGEELSQIYASSDLFVFPSTTDTLGQVVLESQASGLPTIVSDVGGPQEVIRGDGADARTGYVLPADNPRRWTTTIVKLLTDRELRQELSGAAHRHAQQYSIESSFDHFWQMHEQIAGRNVVCAAFEPDCPASRRLAPPIQLDSVPA